MAISPGELSRIWHASSASLTMLARARCRCPDDCVQEAFIRLAQQPEMPREPIAWLSRVVRNEAISQWRSESRRTRREETAAVARQQWFDSHQDGSTDPLDLLALTQSLQSLEVEDLEILVAHIWTGLSFRQIADSFALSLTMVHRRYHAALKQLRVVMDGNQLEHKYTDLTQACSLRPSEAKYHE